MCVAMVQTSTKTLRLSRQLGSATDNVNQAEASRLRSIDRASAPLQPFRNLLR